ncbi:hypothetical protein ACFVL4_17860 [Bacillus subtilis]|uniref:hypothetical protein n=1 Tax=Bacillus subtilis TaxID=1423 RepID=UPI00254AE4EC|nr:hypothetical protein [Bacillus subtilis]MDK7656996.1 hypothetical protein [Bacillus subtilis]
MKRKLMIIMTMVLFLIAGCGRLDAESEAKKFKEYDLKEEKGYYSFYPTDSNKAIISSIKNDPNTFDEQIRKENISDDKEGVVVWLSTESDDGSVRKAMNKIAEKDKELMPDWVIKEVLDTDPEGYFDKEIDVDGMPYPYHLKKKEGELLVVFKYSFKYYIFK